MTEFLSWLIANSFAALGILYFYIYSSKKTFAISLKTIIIFLIGILISTIIKYDNHVYTSVISYFIFYPVLFYSISSISIKEAIYYSAIIWICGALFDFLTMIIISLGNFAFHLDIDNLWFKIVPTMMNFFFFIFGSKLRFLKTFTNKAVILLCNIKYFDLLLIIFLIFTFVGGAAIVNSVKSLNLIILIFILFTLMIILFFLIIHCKNLDYEFNILVKNLQINNSFYTGINDEYSMFKHNLIARLLSIKSVSNKKARELVDDVIKDFNSDIDYHKLILDLPYGLDGVINQKLNDYSEKLEIKVSNNLEHDIFDVLTPKRYNVLVEKLSLMIDNAIEASLKSVDKVLIINIIEENDSIRIEVKNTFAGKIDLDKLGKMHYSSNGNKHGFGLYSILRNNEVSVNVKIVNEYFVGDIIARFI